ncbi:MAG: 4Fe-4S binding protein [Candidatus Obscuribacterales bacterium]|nr:4Fe-4S binding protein [Candidatus Obscuribacterales bacterium]
MFALVGRSIESLRQVARGLGTVLKHAAREPITKEFPDTMPQLAGHFRGRLALAVNPQTGDHLCISCLQCERVCPDKCIQITSHKSPETNKPELINFKIDHGLCMFCGLCTEVCPTNCIINTNDFEMADYSRESLVYDLKKLTLTQDESAHYYSKKELPMPKPKPKPAAKPAAGAAAAKPAADKPAGKPEAKAEAKPEAKPESAEAKPAAAAPEAKAAEESAAKPAETQAKAEDSAAKAIETQAKTVETATKAEETAAKSGETQQKAEEVLKAAEASTKTEESSEKPEEKTREIDLGRVPAKSDEAAETKAAEEPKKEGEQ